jgi:hypothetical protein
MSDRGTHRAFALMLVAGALVWASCEVVLRGTLGGDCDPPRTLQSSDAGATQGGRKSNCQPADSVCCRRSATSRFTVCSYPEDCYRAPFEGACLTPADCADEMACQDGTCQCALGGPSCAPLDGGTAVVCCTGGQMCIKGKCTDTATPGP